MGYRTNQCQSCGNWGHNRRGCPQIKEAHAKVEAMAKKYGIEKPDQEWVSTAWIDSINAASMKANGNVDHPEDTISWRARWHWEETEERKNAQARKNKRGRKCGFCDERGHNARTCESKKQHRKDCDAMRGLAHRVLAACLKKAGIVPGALMRKRDWDHNKSDYAQTICMVTSIEWDRIAEPGYNTPGGAPRHFDEWFKSPIIRVRMPNGDEGNMRLPQDIKQQSHYNYYEKESESWGLVSGVANGNINEDRGWMGGNETLLSPEAGGVYHWSTNKAGEGNRVVDSDLQPEIDRLVNQVSKWRDGQ